MFDLLSETVERSGKGKTSVSHVKTKGFLSFYLKVEMKAVDSLMEVKLKL